MTGYYDGFNACSSNTENSDDGSDYQSESSQDDNTISKPIEESIG
jgi:hypothetical protein